MVIFVEIIIFLSLFYPLCFFAFPFYRWTPLGEVLPPTSPFTSISQNLQGTLQISVTNNQTWIYTSELGWVYYNFTTLLGQNSVSLSLDGADFVVGATDGWVTYTGATVESGGIYDVGSVSSSGSANTNSASISHDGQMLVLGTKFDGIWTRLTSTQSALKRITRTSEDIGDVIGQISSVRASSNLISSNLFAIGNPSSSAYSTTSLTDIFNSISPIGTLNAMSTSYSISYDQDIHLITTKGGILVSTDSGLTWTSPPLFEGLSVTYGDLSLTEGRFMAVIVGNALYLSSNYGQTWIKDQTFSSTLTSVSLSSDGASLSVLEGVCINQGACYYENPTYSCSFIQYCNPSSSTTTAASSSLQFLQLDSSSNFPIALSPSNQYSSLDNTGDNWRIEILSSTTEVATGPLSSSSAFGIYLISIVNSKAYTSTNAGTTWIPVEDVKGCVGAAMAPDGSFAYLINETTIWKGEFYDADPSEVPPSIPTLPSTTSTTTSISTDLAPSVSLSTAQTPSSMTPTATSTSTGSSTQQPYYWYKVLDLPTTSSPFQDVDLNTDGSVQIAITNNETFVFTPTIGWSSVELETVFQAQRSVSLSADNTAFAIGANDGWAFWSSSSVEGGGGSGDGSFTTGSATLTGTSFVNGVSLSSDSQTCLMGTPYDGVWSLSDGSFKRIPRTGSGIGEEIVGVSFLGALHNSTSTLLYAIPSTSSFEHSYISRNAVLFSTFSLGEISPTCAEITSFSVSDDSSVQLLTCSTGILVSTDSGLSWSTPSGVSFTSSYISGGSLNKESGQFMSIIVGATLWTSASYGQQWSNGAEFSAAIVAVSMSPSAEGITLLSEQSIHQGACQASVPYECTFITYTTELTPLRYIELGDGLEEYPIAHNIFQSYVSVNGEKKFTTRLTQAFMDEGPLDSYSSNYSYQVEIRNSVAYVSSDYGTSFSPVLDVEGPIGAAMSSDGFYCYLITSSDVWKGSLGGPPPVTSTSTTSRSTTSGSSTSTATSATTTPQTTTTTPQTTTTTPQTTTTITTTTQTTTQTSTRTTETSSTRIHSSFTDTTTTNTTTDTTTDTSTDSTSITTWSSHTGGSTTTSSPSTTSTPTISSSSDSTHTLTTSTGTTRTTTTSTTSTTTTTTTSIMTSCPSTISSTVVSSTTVYYPCYSTEIKVYIVVIVDVIAEIPFTNVIWVTPTPTSTATQLLSCPTSLPANTIIDQTSVFYGCISTIVNRYAVVDVNVDRLVIANVVVFVVAAV